MKFLLGLACLCLLSFRPVSADIATDFSLNNPQAAADTGLVSNTAIDIIAYNGGVWLITGKGVMFTSDLGQTWLRYDVSNGLVSDNVSAIFAHPSGRLWIGSAHEETIGEALFTISDGISYTDDFGDTWTQVDFSASGQDIPFVTGGDRTVFEITGQDDPVNSRQWLFSMAFAAGQLMSQDNGQTWQRFYPSVSDSIQFNQLNTAPSLRNRTFSGIADTAHADSVFLWTGTASGIFQYIWLRPEDKLYSTQFNTVTLCDTCTDSSTVGLFVAGDNALSIGRRTGGPFRSITAGLLANAYVTALEDYANRLLIGYVDAGLNPSLAYSDDLGNSFMSILSAAISDTVVSFEPMGDRVYLAARTSGLLVSTDTGLTWNRILIDSLEPANSPINIVNDMSALADTLFVGTDSGLALLFLASDGTIDSSAYRGFLEDDARSRRVIRVATQYFNYDSLGGTYDSLIFWTINRPATVNGTAMVGRSSDRTAQFAFLKPDTAMNDIGFVGDTVYLVGDSGIFRSAELTAPLFSFERITPSSSGFSLAGEDVLDIETAGKRVVLATERSIAVSTETDSTRNWRIYRGNLDSSRADVVINYTYENTLFVDTSAIRVGLTGDFIPALDVQYRDGDRPRIWASGRPVSAGGNGIAVARFNEDTNGNISLRWRGINFQQFAWNFAFNGDTVFAATNAGVLWKNMQDSLETDGSFSTTWDTIQFNQTPDQILEPGTPVYAVEVIDGNIWVGSGNGTVLIALDDFADQTLFKAQNDDVPVDEVFAFPTPFRPGQGGECHFHFTVDTDAEVTLEIYDFAMNLVARPIDNVFYPAGTYHGVSPGGGQGITWDGRNGQGDLVAVDMYYFKVSYSTGEQRWGKIAVIP